MSQPWPECVIALVDETDHLFKGTLSNDTVFGSKHRIHLGILTDIDGAEPLPVVTIANTTLIINGSVCTTRPTTRGPDMYAITTPRDMQDAVYRGVSYIPPSESNLVVDIDLAYNFAPGTLSNATPLNRQVFVSHVDASNAPRRVSGYIMDTTGGDAATLVMLNCEASATHGTVINWVVFASSSV
jgi:hypothetical protein